MMNSEKMTGMPGSSVCEALKLDAAFRTEAARRCWTECGADSGAASAFLKPENVEAEFARIGSPVDCGRELRALAETVRKTPELFSFFCFLRHDFGSAGASSVNYWGVAELDCGGRVEPGLFALLAALTFLPRIREKYAALGAPERYADAVPLWIGGTIPTYMAGHGGRPGHDIRQTLWLRHAAAGRLFRVGRFEFLLEDRLPDELPEVFRRRADGAVLALAKDGWAFDASGFRCRTGEEAEAFFVSRLMEDADSISGVPVSPRGFAFKPEVTLKKSDWTRLDPARTCAVSMHIPGGGGMTPQVTSFSLSKMLRFFPKYLGRKIDLVFCHSWILDPVLEEKLPYSNIAALQRRCYLFPVSHDGCGDTFFVFGRHDNGNWRSFAAENTMQKTILSVLASGRPYRNGGMFLLPEEIVKSDSLGYRAVFPLSRQ